MSMLSDEEIRKAREDLLTMKLEKVKRLEAELENQKNLPHMHLHKFFPWQRQLIDCTERVQIITAANQVGKSSTMIKKNIEFATNEDLWATIWPQQIANGERPTLFWYLYPTSDMFTAEFYDKWMPLMPVNRRCPKRGWREMKANGKLIGLAFNTGVYLYFKSYGQGKERLQGGTVWMCTADEECDADIVPELQMRVTAKNGILLFGFTATKGQEFWRLIVEERKKWPHAWVRQVALFDCMQYEDGAPTLWTKERVQQAINSCVSEAEIKRRIYGRFIKDEGVAVHTFNRTVHLLPYVPVPKEWQIYIGVDWGKGKTDVKKGRVNPSSLVFVAVSPQNTDCRVIRAWRGDDVQTTAQDVVEQFARMQTGLETQIAGIFYDYGAADLGTIGQRMGYAFQRADKARDKGIATVATLFQGDFLRIYEPSEASRDLIPDDFIEGAKLALELESVPPESQRAHIIDDLFDALRYAVNGIPFDWEEIRKKVQNKTTNGHIEGDKKEATIDRRTYWQTGNKEHDDSIEQELEFWADIIG